MTLETVLTIVVMIIATVAAYRDGYERGFDDGAECLARALDEDGLIDVDRLIEMTQEEYDG